MSPCMMHARREPLKPSRNLLYRAILARSSQLVLSLEDDACGDPAVTGGKGASLAALTSLARRTDGVKSKESRTTPYIQFAITSHPDALLPFYFRCTYPSVSW